MSTFINILIAILAVVDAFFISYAIGLNVRSVKIPDQSLAPRAAEVSTPTTVTTTTTESSSATESTTANDAGSTQGASSFTDLTQTDARLQPSLQKAADAGILDFTKDKQFRPNDPVTRADFTRWMVRTRQTPLEKPDTATYGDVDAANPYYQEIEGASKAMMVQGYNVKGKPQKSFKPEQYITRQEFAVMYGTFSGKRGRAEQLKKEDIEKYLRYNPASSKSENVTFKDVGDVDDWALKWVAVANQAGVLEQCFDVNPSSDTVDKKYLHPQQQMTRAEAVNILVKLYGAQSRAAVQEKDAAQNQDVPQSKESTPGKEAPPAKTP